MIQTQQFLYFHIAANIYIFLFLVMVFYLILNVIFILSRNKNTGNSRVTHHHAELKIKYTNNPERHGILILIDQTFIAFKNGL